jgi:hypothetical protein
MSYQYYKEWVAYNICVTNYYLLSNPRHQSTLPNRVLRGRSTCRCVTRSALYEFWTKFCNITLLKIIIFSHTSSPTPACTYKHMIISFHNQLSINLSITYISLPCLESINKLFFPNFVDDNPLTAIKTDSCCNIMNTSDEISARKVLCLTLYMYAISQSFVCLQIFVIVLYCILSMDLIHRL